MSTKLCAICSKLRGVEEHLFELGTMCELLGNESIYNGEDGPSVASLATVGLWLKLGAQLEKVEIDTWRFENSSDSLMCRPAADEIDSSSSHLSNYSTSFTRFMFVASALEEIYRYLNGEYLKRVHAINPNRKDRAKPSIRTALLIDQLDAEHRPEHFEHVCGSFSKLFERFRARRGLKLSGMHHTELGRSSYALHLVRNLRNEIAHGALLPGAHPEYVMDSEAVTDMLHVMRAATLITAVYIQFLVKAFNRGFQSDKYRYLQIEADESEADGRDGGAEVLLRESTADYLRVLHIQQTFATHKYHA